MNDLSIYTNLIASYQSQIGQLQRELRGLEGITETDDTINNRRFSIEQRIAGLNRELENANAIVNDYREAERLSQESPSENQTAEEIEAQRESLFSDIDARIEQLPINVRIQAQIARARQKVEESIRTTPVGLPGPTPRPALSVTGEERTLANQISDAQGNISRVTEDLRILETNGYTMTDEEYENRRNALELELAQYQTQLAEYRQTAYNRALSSTRAFQEAETAGMDSEELERLEEEAKTYRGFLTESQLDQLSRDLNEQQEVRNESNENVVSSSTTDMLSPDFNPHTMPFLDFQSLYQDTRAAHENEPEALRTIDNIYSDVLVRRGRERSEQSYRRDRNGNVMYYPETTFPQPRTRGASESFDDYQRYLETEYEPALRREGYIQEGQDVRALAESKNPAFLTDNSGNVLHYPNTNIPQPRLQRVGETPEQYNDFLTNIYGPTLQEGAYISNQNYGNFNPDQQEVRQQTNEETPEEAAVRTSQEELAHLNDMMRQLEAARNTMTEEEYNNERQNILQYMRAEGNRLQEANNTLREAQATSPEETRVAVTPGREIVPVGEQNTQTGDTGTAGTTDVPEETRVAVTPGREIVPVGEQNTQTGNTGTAGTTDAQEETRVAVTPGREIVPVGEQNTQTGNTGTAGTTDAQEETRVAVTPGREIVPVGEQNTQTDDTGSEGTTDGTVETQDDMLSPDFNPHAMPFFDFQSLYRDTRNAHENEPDVLRRIDDMYSGALVRRRDERTNPNYRRNRDGNVIYYPDTTFPQPRPRGVNETAEEYQNFLDNEYRPALEQQGYVREGEDVRSLSEEHNPAFLKDEEGKVLHYPNTNIPQPRLQRVGESTEDYNSFLTNEYGPTLQEGAYVSNQNYGNFNPDQQEIRQQTENETPEEVAVRQAQEEIKHLDDEMRQLEEARNNLSEEEYQRERQNIIDHLRNEGKKLSEAQEKLKETTPGKKEIVPYDSSKKEIVPSEGIKEHPTNAEDKKDKGDKKVPAVVDGSKKEIIPYEGTRKTSTNDEDKKDKGEKQVPAVVDDSKKEIVPYDDKKKEIIPYEKDKKPDSPGGGNGPSGGGDDDGNGPSGGGNDDEPIKEEQKQGRALYAILSDVLKDKDGKPLAINKKTGKRLKAANIKVGQSFMADLKMGNKLYTIVSALPGILSVPFKAGYKLISKIALKFTGQEDIGKIIRKNLEKLPPEDKEVILQEYKAGRIVELKDQGFAPLNDAILDTIVRPDTEKKVTEINKRISTNYQTLFATYRTVQQYDKQLADPNISQEEKDRITIARQEALKGSAALVKETREIRNEGDALYSNGLQGFSSDVKAAESKMNLQGLRFAKDYGFDEKQAAILDSLGKLDTAEKTACAAGKDEEALEAFIGMETLKSKETEIKKGLMGERSVGRLQYSPLVGELDYRDDPFVKKLFTSVSIAVSSLAAANAIRTHMLETPKAVDAHNQHVQDVNAANQASMDRAHQIGQDISAKRGDFAEGMQAQAYQDINNIGNTHERMNLDNSALEHGGWALSSDTYQQGDDLWHEITQNTYDQAHSQLTDIGSQYATGALSQAEALQKISEVSSQTQQQFNDLVAQALPIFNQYAPSHPQFTLDGLGSALEYIAQHPDAIDKMNQGMVDVTNLGDELAGLTVEQVQALQGMPSDMATTLLGSASAVVLASKVASAMDSQYSPRKSNKYGNELTEMVSDFVAEQEAQEEVSMQKTA